MHFDRTDAMPHDIIGSTEACTILAVDKSTLSRWVAAGRITPVARLPRKNGALIFNRSDIDALAAERATA
jgi:predicted site-specific integrase-resolvase